ncbi:class I SAM-dependent methyltransferase [Actinoallomurus soli]|uniref:class I SAM-dependent methyltransferase n=1 Tax=Actinoallomurus soli TaxID=2952535 RepID=UPI0020936659|nr:class I SAM-dependent methyltransferase [Actinoallomurus soli]MCO5970239.1 methyltransferase domain-containing protein [Actinoallomurus soli]
MIEPSLDTTRTAYDSVAVLYADTFRNVLDDSPLDRAMIGAFAELVRAGGGQVADLGCGPGRLTAHLHSLGASAFGIDLSPTMIELARRDHPGLRFEEGSMTALDLADGSVDGVLAWYSVIHMRPEELPTVFAEFGRVLAPGGHLLLGFFTTDDDSPDPAVPFDHKVTTAYRLSIDHVAALAREAGLVELARMRREPRDNERFLQGHLLVRKPAQPA